jgi:hypothetical protein
MAIYRLAIESVGRSTGRRAVDAAAYRAGERLVDGRNGAVYDHSERTDVVHREIVLPEKLAAAPPEWARDRSSLWTEAERAERQRNSRVAREFTIALPHELDAEPRAQLAVRFARELVARYGVAIDVAVHQPRADGDDRNHHAHLLATTRTAEENGLGAKTGLDARRSLEFQSSEFRAVRALWAGLANEALREAGREERIDSRSLREQGIDREPQHQPWHAYKEAARALAHERASVSPPSASKERAVSPPAPSKETAVSPPSASKEHAVSPPAPAKEPAVAPPSIPKELAASPPSASKEPAASPPSAAAQLEAARAAGREAWRQFRSAAAKAGVEMDRTRDGSLEPDQEPDRKPDRKKDHEPEP